MTFIGRDGTRQEVDAPLGYTLLQIARENDVDIEALLDIYDNLKGEK